ncbi:hypothetical protein PI124_g18502 [Phytophthora idaei]|nr:hypothetical protein PI125_g19278 [Phytophthora idaei]KAG3236492.1 hypothetical protein PI124_g18502 [Phytophthora idaei]
MTVPDGAFHVHFTRSSRYIFPVSCTVSFDGSSLPKKPQLAPSPHPLPRKHLKKSKRTGRLCLSKLVCFSRGGQDDVLKIGFSSPSVLNMNMD